MLDPAKLRPRETNLPGQNALPIKHHLNAGRVNIQTGPISFDLLITIVSLPAAPSW